MPDFRPFPALRFAPGTQLSEVLAPPYDVLSEEDVDELHERHPHNITHIDVPEDQDYTFAAKQLWDWVRKGILTSDKRDTFSIYRMSFTDPTGAAREISGVMGGLEVVDDPSRGIPAQSEGRASTVIPHEQTTPKASTDRLELMRATATNTSPVWGLSLAQGLTQALAEPGVHMGSVEAEGAVHTIEKINDPERIKAIRTVLAADDVIIADGHHRYGVSRAYRDQVRAATGRTNTRAERTLAFVNELVEDQLCIEAIHRLYTGISADSLREYLNRFFEFSPATSSPTILADMVARKRLVILWPDGACEWLMPRCGVFDNVRGLDGVWLEMALENSGAEVTYQHGLTEMKNRVKTEDFTAGILIRPTTIEEIQRTAREGLLMPPKSTFFTPKLLTGWVLRASEPLPRRK